MKVRGLTALLLAVALLLLSACVPQGGNDTAKNTGNSDTASGNDATTTVSDEQLTPEGDSIAFVQNGQTDYVIVRPDIDGDTVVINAMVALKNGINSKYGVTITPKNDWLSERNGEKPAEHEILVGKTNREESQKIAEQLKGDLAFAVAVVNQKLVIVGGSSSATAYAVDYFVENMPKDSLTFKRNYLYIGEMPRNAQIVKLDGIVESECYISELYNGVTSTYYSLSAQSKYGLQKFTVVEFDPLQEDLYFRVTMGGSTTNKLNTVGRTVANFNANNKEGLTAISAVKGDLWMVSYAHARILGKGTQYGGYSDAVVTKSLTVPRGFNIYNGEIISSSHMREETPYEGDFYSFGITEDGTPVLGNPKLGIKVTNTTQQQSVNANGLNRLPANNALVMYSDKYSTSNYSLSDAFEIIIDCGYDYTVCHGAKLTGTVTAITNPGGEKQNMKENRIILTARGSQIAGVSGFKVGDKIEIDITLTDALGKTAVWQQMKNAVGGHIPVIINGVSRNSKDSNKYPMSVMGIKRDGKVVMLTNDGRQTSWSVGIMISQLDELCADLDIVTAFLLDGGGSAEMVSLVDGEYKTVNKPSDGSSRTVVNTVILAYGPKKSR